MIKKWNKNVSFVYVWKKRGEGKRKKKCLLLNCLHYQKKKKKRSIAMFLKRGYRTIWPIATFF